MMWRAATADYSMRVLRDRDRGAVEERRQPRQLESRGDRIDVRSAKIARKLGEGGERGQRRLGTLGPDRPIEGLTGASPRQVMTDQSERKIVRQQIWPGHENQETRDANRRESTSSHNRWWLRARESDRLRIACAWTPSRSAG